MLPAAFLAPIIHEWTKAIVSTALGDPTPKNTGFLTPNPFKYFEPIGFMFILVFGYGWARPVPTAALHYRDRQQGIILTYTIPVLVNLLLGIAAVIGVRFMAYNILGPLPSHFFFSFRGFSSFLPVLYGVSIQYSVAMYILAHFAFINISLALFNIIPVFPLAANKLLLTFSRPDNIARFSHYEKPMQVILILGMAFGFVQMILVPAARGIVNFAWGLF